MQFPDLFLREHAFVHSRAVALSEAFNMDYLVADLTAAELRQHPQGMNSLAWLFWHLARVEDGCVGCVVAGRTQVFDEENWGARLNIPRRDIGTGMTKAEMADLSAAVDLAALWEYRNAVGRRTRAIVAELWPDRWLEPATVDDIRRGVAAGVLQPEAEEYLPGKTRESMLFWWGLHHSLMHLGQAQLVRNLVKGGTGT